MYQFDEAFGIFNNLKSQNKYQLDEIFYNSLLDCLLKLKEYERTYRIYEQMKLDNVKPSNVTFSIIIRLNSNCGKI